MTMRQNIQHESWIDFENFLDSEIAHVNNIIDLIQPGPHDGILTFAETIQPALHEVVRAYKQALREVERRHGRILLKFSPELMGKFDNYFYDYNVKDVQIQKEAPGDD